MFSILSEKPLDTRNEHGRRDAAAPFVSMAWQCGQMAARWKRPQIRAKNHVGAVTPFQKGGAASLYLETVRRGWPVFEDVAARFLGRRAHP